MCQFFSAIALRNGDIIHDDATDSHSDLILAFGLSDAENANCQHFVKVEFTPESPDVMDEIDKYTLRVDENETPLWWEEVKETVESKCRSAVKKMILTGEHKMILSGKYILGKNCKVNTVKNSNIVAMLESAKVGEMWGSAIVS